MQELNHVHGNRDAPEDTAVPAAATLGQLHEAALARFGRLERGQWRPTPSLTCD